MITPHGKMGIVPVPQTEFPKWNTGFVLNVPFIREPNFDLIKFGERVDRLDKSRTGQRDNV